MFINFHHLSFYHFFIKIMYLSLFFCMIYLFISLPLVVFLGGEKFSFFTIFSRKNIKCINVLFLESKCVYLFSFI